MGGLCRKRGAPVGAAARIEDACACPLCLGQGAERPLRDGSEAWTCTGCGTAYPVREGVVFLLVPPKLAELYPELARKAAASS